MMEDYKRLSLAFSRIIRSWLSDDEMLWVKSQLLVNPEGGCYTHEICDPNMAMYEAFWEVFDRDIIPSHDRGMSESGCELWNSAWDHSMKCLFENGG